MKIEVRTDNHLKGSEGLNQHVEEWLHRIVERYSDRLTGLEVHLSDVNASRNTPDDKCCKLEARIRGRNPAAVTEHANTVREAVNGAAHKLERVLEKEFAKLAHH